MCVDILSCWILTDFFRMFPPLPGWEGWQRREREFWVSKVSKILSGLKKMSPLERWTCQPNIFHIYWHVRDWTKFDDKFCAQNGNHSPYKSYFLLLLSNTPISPILVSKFARTYAYIHSTEREQVELNSRYIVPKLLLLPWIWQQLCFTISS